MPGIRIKAPFLGLSDANWGGRWGGARRVTRRIGRSCRSPPVGDQCGARRDRDAPQERAGVHPVGDRCGARRDRDRTTGACRSPPCGRPMRRAARLRRTTGACRSPPVGDRCGARRDRDAQERAGVHPVGDQCSLVTRPVAHWVRSYMVTAGFCGEAAERRRRGFMCAGESPTSLRIPACHPPTSAKRGSSRCPLAGRRRCRGRPG